MTNNIAGSYMNMNNGIMTYTTRVGNNFNPFGMNNSLFNFGYNMGNTFSNGINIGNMLPYFFMQNMPMINNDYFNFSGLRMTNPYNYNPYANSTQTCESSKTDTDTTPKKNETKIDEALLKEAADIAGDIYDSTNGIGTDCEKLQSAVSRITKDNVIEVMSSWDNSYQGADGLLEQIQHDTSGDFETLLERHILDALCERAESIGLDEEATATEKMVNSELNSGFWISRNKVVIMLNSLKESIELKENKEKNKNSATVGTVEDNYGQCNSDMSACSTMGYMPMFNYYG